jgi:5-hydroxyisourate hydrolase-like protein (transthyretin family)
MEKKLKKMRFEDLEAAALELLGNPPISVDNLKDVQLFHRSLMQREAARLERKLGSDHPRVQKLNARVATSLKRASATAAELELARIQTPEVEAEEGLVHGRVTLSDKRGLGKLLIRLEDEQGRQIKDLGETQTDRRGYYSIRVDTQTIEKLKKTEKSEVYLAVRDAKGNVIERRQQSIQLEKGTRAYHEVRVEMAGGRPAPSRRPASEAPTEVRKKKAPPRKKPSKPKETPWVVKGRVMDADGEPVAGVLVRLYDKDRQYDDLLGAVTSDEDGLYEITYREQDFKEGLEPGADLYVTVEDVKGNELFRSEDAVRFDAGKEEVIDITLGTPAADDRKT